MSSGGRNLASNYEVIGLLDPEHHIKIGFSGLLCGAVLVVVLAPLFTDLFQALALRSPSQGMRHWGPLVAGVAAALLVTFAGIAAGAPSANPTAWWQDRKFRVTAMLVGLGVAIAFARFSKGVTTIQNQRLAAIERARGDLAAAQKILTESDEAKSILASIREADRLIALGTRKRFPKIRQHGFRLRAEARQAQSELKEAAGKAIAEAQARLRALPSAHGVPTDEVLRVIAGPALTELVFAELGAVVMAFWASVACSPIRRRKRRDPEEEPRLAASTWTTSLPSGSLRAKARTEGDTEARRRHPSLEGVDYRMLDDMTLEGLDEQRGEWFTLPLGRPALRRVKNRRVLWPVLDVGKRGRVVFAGSNEAYALLPSAVLDQLVNRLKNSNEVLPDEEPSPVKEQWLAEPATGDGASQNGEASVPSGRWLVGSKKDEEPN